MPSLHLPTKNKHKHTNELLSSRAPKISYVPLEQVADAKQADNGKSSPYQSKSDLRWKGKMLAAAHQYC